MHAGATNDAVAPGTERTSETRVDRSVVSAGEARAVRVARATGAVEDGWYLYGKALRTRPVYECRQRKGAPPLQQLLTTMHTLRDIVNSLYGTRVDGVAVPETDLKVYLSDIVHATTLSAFATGGVGAVAKSKATEARARYVVHRAVEDALTLLALSDEATDDRVVLLVTGERHVHRNGDQRRAVRGTGRARRGAGLVVCARGSAALVAALDLALVGVGRAAVR